MTIFEKACAEALAEVEVHASRMRKDIEAGRVNRASAELARLDTKLKDARRALRQALNDGRERRQ